MAARDASARDSCGELWRHFLERLVAKTIRADVVSASYPSVIEEGEAFVANVSKVFTSLMEDIATLIGNIQPNMRIVMIDPLPARVKEVLQLIDCTNEVLFFRLQKASRKTSFAMLFSESISPYPSWATIKRKVNESGKDSYVDSGNTCWNISFSAALGFFQAQVLDEWLRLGSTQLRNQVFFRKPAGDKTLNVSLGIRYTPNLQIYFGQLAVH